MLARLAPARAGAGADPRRRDAAPPRADRRAARRLSRAKPPPARRCRRCGWRRRSCTSTRAGARRGRRRGAAGALEPGRGAARRARQRRGAAGGGRRRCALGGDAGGRRCRDWLAGPLDAAWGPEARRAIEAAQRLRPPIDLTPRDRTRPRRWAAALGGGACCRPAACGSPAGRRSPGCPATPRAPGGCRTPRRRCRRGCSGRSAGARRSTSAPRRAARPCSSPPPGRAVVAVDASEARIGPAARQPRPHRARGRDGRRRRARLGAGAVVRRGAARRALHRDRHHPPAPGPAVAARPGATSAGWPSCRPRCCGGPGAGWRRAGGWSTASARCCPRRARRRRRASSRETPDARVVPPDPALGIEPGWVDAIGGLRTRPDLWPERGGLDGFYAIAFDRRVL